MTINDRLAAAAAALGSMPAEEVKRQLQRLEDEHRRRRRNGTLEPFRRPDAYAEGFALRMKQRVL